ncbi:MAG TPA: PGRS family protein, partial [Labilithrix sp.]|nr:PGRS family protein [Labilithrix sp.]
GKGGAGGAGGGGPSVGILYAGAAPKTEGVAVNLGTGGKGGLGISAPNGAAGLARDTHEIAETVSQ